MTQLGGYYNPAPTCKQSANQYAAIKSDVIHVAHKYSDTQDMVLTFSKGGPNSIMGIGTIYLNANTSRFVSRDFSALTIFKTVDSDWIGPIQVAATSSIDGDATSTETFTGGWHGYGGESGGTATARTVSYEVFADGVSLSESDGLIGCKELTIKVVNRIQAYNTKKTDGSGREVLEETVVYTIRDGTIHVTVQMEALEAVTIPIYYGLQSQVAATDTVHFVGGAAKARQVMNALRSSGIKGSYPVERACVRSGTDNMVLQLDSSFGMGSRDCISVGESCFFSISQKIYSELVYGVTKSMAAAEQFFWRGSYTFFPGSASGNMDLAYLYHENGEVKAIVDFLAAGTETFALPEQYQNMNVAMESNSPSISLPLDSTTPEGLKVTASGYGTAKITFKELVKPGYLLTMTSGVIASISASAYCFGNGRNYESSNSRCQKILPRAGRIRSFRLRGITDTDFANTASNFYARLVVGTNVYDIGLVIVNQYDGTPYYLMSWDDVNSRETIFVDIPVAKNEAVSVYLSNGTSSPFPTNVEFVADIFIEG